MKVSLISLFCWAKGFHISNPQQLVGSTEQTPVNVMRIDRDSPYSNNKSFHLLTTTQQPQVILKALSADEAFLVRLTCPSIPADVCQKVNTALQNAGKRLVSNLLITRQIILKATFRSFCGGQPASTCQRANTLGSATYGSAFVVAEGDTHYSI